MNKRLIWSVIVVDAALVAEVAIAVYLASRHPDQFTPVFLKTFFALLVPTLVLGRLAIRKAASGGSTLAVGAGSSDVELVAEKEPD